MSAKIYIRGTGVISPQKTFGDVPFLNELIKYNNNRLTCIEPVYKELIDVKMIRRMSRIIKMGVAAALRCLEEAGVAVPDTIITGTAYGCLEDTGVFLKKMIETDEEVFTPTAFIQSTHNTIGAQIALILQCTGYNNAFAQGGHSFENALLDAMMLLEENEAENVLVGGIDEITDVSHAVLSRFGLYRKEPVSSLELYASSSKGTVAGEGASFFMLTAKHSANDYAQFDALATFYKPVDFMETEQQITVFLAEQNIGLKDIDLIITGRNGDSKNDSIYSHLNESVFKDLTTVNYKHLCGEYPTAVAFALWLTAGIIKTGEIPKTLSVSSAGHRSIKNVLIYNHYQNINHTLMLLSSC